MDTEALFIACDRYQAMQANHLQRLTATEALDLAPMVFEREQQFAALHNHLTALVYHLRTMTDSAGLMASVAQRLQTLRQRDAVLTQRLADYRALLEQQRERLQDGQRLVCGYGALPVNTPACLVDVSS